MQGFEYQVCSVQYGRVTFVNNVWQGGAPIGEDTGAALESCPLVWEYLRAAGLHGWELVGTTSHPQPQPDAVQDTLYLKRPSW
ncbi:MAG TPA: hypothetical protein VF521_18010 [Pyrinomonadaceae bacterium]